MDGKKDRWSHSVIIYVLIDSGTVRTTKPGTQEQNKDVKFKKTKFLTKKTNQILIFEQVPADRTTNFRV